MPRTNSATSEYPLGGVGANNLARDVLDGPYAKYVLVVLFLVNTVGYIDRQILAVVAEEVKADLRISDADLGFLFGTAFSVFFATFGLALGRLADSWNRMRLISWAGAFWSLMTTLSGTARSFLPLAFYRFGVGAGESCATPSALSILCDYFSPRRRTTAMSLYQSSIYIGGGLGLMLGGLVLNAWSTAWPDTSLAPFGLKAWQVTFMLMGVPGLLLSVWVWTLREPVRGVVDGIADTRKAEPAKETLTALASMVPIVNLFLLAKAGGYRAVAINCVAALFIVLGVWGLISLTGDVLQWVAVGVGVFAGVGWAQALGFRDPVVFGLMFRCKTVLCMYVAAGGLMFKATLIFWCVPFFQRYHGANISEVGTVMGVGGLVCGFAGIVVGGVVADKLRVRNGRGKLYVILFAMVLALAAGFVLLAARNLTVAYGAVLCLYLTSAMAQGTFSSVTTDLVLPRARSTATGFNIMATSLLGISVMPYIVGYISDSIAATGVAAGEALRQGMLYGMVMPVIGLVFLVIATISVARDEANLLERARKLGEPI